MHKKLTRSRTNNILGGVCGGLGEYFDTDPILFRIIFLILLFVFGSGILLYLILWIIIPQKQLFFDDPIGSSKPNAEQFNSESSNTEQSKTEQFNLEKKSSDGSLIAGVILILLGVIFLLRYFVSWIYFSKLWPILLIVFGIFMISRYFIQLNNKNENEKK